MGRYICKGKLNGRLLNTFEVRNKPNLNNIFKSYKGYNDLEGMCISLYYFKNLQNNTIWPFNILCNCKTIM